MNTNTVFLGQRIDAPRGTTTTALTLEPGRWYCIGFKVMDFERGGFRDDFGPIYKLDSFDGGHGVWVDEDGEVRDQIYDPVLGDYCHPDSADFFVVQS